jgi:hypothetical protein
MPRLGMNMKIDRVPGSIKMGGDIPPRPFITVWDLSISGSGATQLTFGVATGGTVAYEWEEISPGSATGSGTFSASPLTITGLPAGAVIRLKIGPENFQRISINNGTDRQRLTDIEQWGDVAWTSMSLAFHGTNNLAADISALDLPKLAGVTSFSNIFRTSSFNDPSIVDWDVSAVTNFTRGFQQALMNQPVGVWDVSGAETMNNMFRSSGAFNQDIGAWRPSACTDFNLFMGDKSAANYSAANLASIYSGWPQGSLNNGQSIGFSTIKYAASGSPGRAFLTRTTESVAVAGATNNAGEIQIETSAAHGRSTGDFIFISGVGGTVEANGGWLITVIDATNFTLDGSTFANAYTSGGTVQIGRGWTITDGGLE